MFVLVKLISKACDYNNKLKHLNEVRLNHVLQKENFNEKKKDEKKISHWRGKSMSIFRTLLYRKHSRNCALTSAFLCKHTNFPLIFDFKFGDVSCLIGYSFNIENKCFATNMIWLIWSRMHFINKEVNKLCVRIYIKTLSAPLTSN